MRRFFNDLLNILSNFRTTTPTRTNRQTQRRASLQVEALEDRLVMSTLSTVQLSDGVLQVGAVGGFVGPSAPGRPPIVHLREITFEVDKEQPTKLEILDGTTPLARYNIASIKSVNVNLAGLDKVIVDDSNGQPFAASTTVSLAGSGSNFLDLTGSQTIQGETYFGGTGSQAADVVVGGIVGGPAHGYVIQFGSAVGSVTDSLKTTASPVVESYGSNVTLSGQDGATQNLGGLSSGGSGGDSYTFSNKNDIGLEMLSPKASVILNTSAAAVGEHEFDVAMIATGGFVQINATPKNVNTTVAAGEDAFVGLAANSGSVLINGDATSLVSLGRTGAAVNSLPTTAGIDANVSVFNVGSLTVADDGNHSTKENVTVTESTISGTGLFGNNAVKLSYSFVRSVGILTGQLGDTYNVVASKPGALFRSEITIADFSQVGLSVFVTVDSGSALDLNLRNDFASPNTASLFITAASGGTFSEPIHNPPDGTVDVAFANGLTSQIDFDGFGNVSLS